MRVLHCIWRMGVGGAERQLGYLAHGLVLRGIDVHIALVFQGPYATELNRAGVSVHHIVGSKRDPLVPARLISLCRRLQPAVMHTWLTQMDIIGGISSTFLRVPWVLSERSSEGSYPPSLLNSTRRRLGVRASAVTANSEAGADYWRRAGANGAIHIIENIVPVERIAAAQPAVERLPFDATHPVVLFVGRLSAEKNVSTFLNAIAIASKRTRLTAVVCGSGALRSQLEQQANALEVSPFTFFMGEVSNPWALMQRAAVLVSPSFFEGRPNVVLEAIAAGTPLVLSDVTAHRAIVDDTAALFADPHSPPAMAEKILSVLADPAGAAERAEKARTQLGSTSEETIAEQYERVYREVCEG